MEFNIKVDDDFTFDVIEESDEHNFCQVKTEPQWDIENEEITTIDYKNLKIKEEFDVDIEENYVLNNEFRSIVKIKSEFDRELISSNSTVFFSNTSSLSSKRNDDIKSNLKDITLQRHTSSIEHSAASNKENCLLNSVNANEQFVPSVPAFVPFIRQAHKPLTVKDASFDEDVVRELWLKTFCGTKKSQSKGKTDTSKPLDKRKFEIESQQCSVVGEIHHGDKNGSKKSQSQGKTDTSEPINKMKIEIKSEQCSVVGEIHQVDKSDTKKSQSQSKTDTSEPLDKMKLEIESEQCSVLDKIHHGGKSSTKSLDILKKVPQIVISNISKNTSDSNVTLEKAPANFRRELSNDLSKSNCNSFDITNRPSKSLVPSSTSNMSNKLNFTNPRKAHQPEFSRNRSRRRNRFKRCVSNFSTVKCYQRNNLEMWRNERRAFSLNRTDISNPRLQTYNSILCVLNQLSATLNQQNDQNCLNDGIFSNNGNSSVGRCFPPFRKRYSSRNWRRYEEPKHHRTEVTNFKGNKTNYPQVWANECETNPLSANELLNKFLSSAQASSTLQTYTTLLCAVNQLKNAFVFQNGQSYASYSNNVTFKMSFFNL